MFSPLDFRSRSPIYVQLVERIKNLIATGALNPGDQLPTVRQMAAELAVNFNTIARAYRILGDEGIVTAQRGRGTYVLESVAHESSSRLRKNALENMTSAFLWNARRYGFGPDEVAEALDTYMDTWREQEEPTGSGH